MDAPRESVLHNCRMPGGYYAPRALPKLLYENVVFGPSRKCSIDFLIGLLQKTIITCGRCGTPILDKIWNREDAESLFDLAKAKDRDHLERRMYREYDNRVMTCLACNHTAHLAWDGETPDNPSGPF